MTLASFCQSHPQSGCQRNPTPDFDTPSQMNNPLEQGTPHHRYHEALVGDLGRRNAKRGGGVARRPKHICSDDALCLVCPKMQNRVGDPRQDRRRSYPPRNMELHTLLEDYSPQGSLSFSLSVSKVDGVWLVDFVTSLLGDWRVCHLSSTQNPHLPTPRVWQRAARRGGRTPETW